MLESMETRINEHENGGGGITIHLYMGYIFGFPLINSM